MIQYSRKINNFEKMFANANEQCQVAVETEDPSIIPMLIKNFTKAMIGFNLRLEGDELIYRKCEVPIYSLPRGIRTCESACNYVEVHYKIKSTDPLCKIAVNDNIVAVSALHMLYDGGFFINLFPKLTEKIDDQNYLNFSKLRKVPYTPYELFPRKFSQSMTKLIEKHYDDLQRLPHVKVSSQLDDNVDSECYITSHSFECPAKEYQFLTNKMSLTDMYWTFIPICLMALDNRQQPLGMSSCVDLRQFMKKTDINRLVCQNFTQVNMSPNVDTSKMTVREVGKLIRARFNEIKIDGTLFASFAAFCEGKPPKLNPNFLYPGISNIGRFVCKPPITDCFAQQTLKSKYNGCYAAFSCFSKTKHGVNTVSTRFLQPPTLLNSMDSNALARSVVHAMKNISVDATVQQAFDDVRSFQSKVRLNKL